jgi:8-oxo-dGTP diphosphatase
MNIIEKLAWIEIANKSILSTRSFGREKFYIPGGKRENNETDKEALVREIKEELTVELIESSIKFIGIFEAQADNQKSGTIVKMICYTGKYIGELKASSEIEEIIWLNADDENKISEVDKLIFKWLKSQDLIS